MSKTVDRDRLERATAARLAKLAARPVDAARLQRRMEQELNDALEGRSRVPEVPGEEPSMAQRRVQPCWQPGLIAAASVLLVVTLGWLVLGGGTSPVMAAPAEFSQIHFDMTRGLAPHVEVSSVAEANRLLADQPEAFTPLPELPGTLRAACLHQLASVTLTCALIEVDGESLTVAVADASRLRSPAGRIVTRDGRSFIVHTVNGIRMVMTPPAPGSGGPWLCVKGQAATEKLVAVAAAIAAENAGPRRAHGGVAPGSACVPFRPGQHARVAGTHQRRAGLNNAACQGHGVKFRSESAWLTIASREAAEAEHAATRELRCHVRAGAAL